MTPEPVSTQPERRRRERLIGLTVLGMLALNYPLVALFSHVRLFFGIPLLYLYLFAVWALVIALVARAVAYAESAPKDQ